MSIVHIDLHLHAKQDLFDLMAVDKRAAAAIAITIEQIEADPSAIDKLTTHGNNDFGQVRLGIKRWESMQRHGNIWRFRVLDTPATSHRVVYGYQWQTRQLCVLAIVHKEAFDYDDINSDLAKRIAADWRNL